MSSNGLHDRDPAPVFDLREVLDREHAGLMDLFERHVNPALAGVLQTIGFDQRWVRGEGAYLFDDKGDRYIDCLGGYAVFAGGRNHPVINAAITQALQMQLPSLPGVGLFRLAPLLARELVAMVPGNRAGEPGELERVYFASGGGEAVDAAIKMARRATGRPRVVYCHRAYHGLTIGGLSVTGNSEFREGFGTLLDTVEIPFGDAPALARELQRGDIAAFIVEPIQGKGVNLPGPEYLASCAQLCKQHGAVFILDEIQTGLGRTGRAFASEHFGCGAGWTPDLLILGKALSGGMVPTSAVVGKKWVFDRTFDGMKNCSKIQNTFGMNDLSMAAALASLHVLRTERLVERSRDVGAYLLGRLRDTLARHEMVREVRGLGLMIAIEFARPKSLTLRLGWDAVHAVDANLFCQSVIIPLMREHKVLAQVAGHRLDVIKLIPPLVLSEHDADAIVAALDATIGAIHTGAGPAWIIPKLAGATIKRFVPAGA